MKAIGIAGTASCMTSNAQNERYHLKNRNPGMQAGILCLKCFMTNKRLNSKFSADDLIYRRQFVVAPGKIKPRGNFTILPLTGNYNVHIQKDLAYATLKKSNCLLVLLGYAVSFEEDYHEDKLLEQIFTEDIEGLTANMDKYCGRYVIILVKKGNILLFNDPATLRKVFWIESNHEIWCASQPQILAEFLHIDKTTDPDALEFFQSKEFIKSKSIGVIDKTIFKNINQLLPNHYLNFNNKRTHRFWPYKKLVTLGVSEAAKKSGSILKGYLENLGRKHQLMMPVTEGLDSRILLSASRNISDKVFYYVNVEKNHCKKSNCLKIPSRLMDKLNLKYHVIQIKEDINPEFERIYRLNNSFIFKRRIPVIYNYFQNFENYINVPGNFSEVAKNAFRFYEDKMTGQKLCKAYYRRNFQYVIKEYDQWIENSRDCFASNNVRTTDMFYWEERMTNWGTVYQINKDIAQEEFWPFDSRYLMEIMLGTAYQCRDEHVGNLHREMILYLWPEALMLPTNPNITNSIALILKRLNLYRLLLRLSIIKRF
jgi:hypothetical protein